MSVISQLHLTVLRFHNAVHQEAPMTSARFHLLAYLALALALAGLVLTPTFAQGASDTPKLTERERQAIRSHGLGAPEPTVHVNPSTGQVSAKPSADPGIYVHPDQAAPAAARAAARTALATASPPLEPQAAADDASSAGFDWLAAAIGAAAGSLLVGLVVVAPLGAGRRRRHAART